tara:strand:- start:8 stop:133 length:126 start_codon:yes stop_codon:yes gene_type:complete
MGVKILKISIWFKGRKIDETYLPAFSNKKEANTWVQSQDEN